MEVDGYNCWGGGGAITKTFDICPAPYHVWEFICENEKEEDKLEHQLT